MWVCFSFVIRVLALLIFSPLFGLLISQCISVLCVSESCLFMFMTLLCSYVLGAVFLQLCQVLRLQEHPIVRKPIDPSLFLYKYTNSKYAVICSRPLQIFFTLQKVGRPFLVELLMWLFHPYHYQHVYLKIVLNYFELRKFSFNF